MGAVRAAVGFWQIDKKKTGARLCEYFLGRVLYLSLSRF